MVLTESGSHAVKETTLCAVQYVRPMQSHLQVTAHLIRGGGGVTAWNHVHQRIETKMKTKITFYLFSLFPK